jgi:hypothetical protein
MERLGGFAELQIILWILVDDFQGHLILLDRMGNHQAKMRGEAGISRCIGLDISRFWNCSMEKSPPTTPNDRPFTTIGI